VKTGEGWKVVYVIDTRKRNWYLGIRNYCNV